MSFHPPIHARCLSTCRIGWIAAAIAGAMGACSDGKRTAPPDAAASDAAVSEVAASDVAAPDAAVSDAAPPAGSPIVAETALVAELLDKGPRMPDCGTLHIRVAMRYRALRVLRGTTAVGSELFVIHGCPELTRAAYGGAQAGDLEAFRTGD